MMLPAASLTPAEAYAAAALFALSLRATQAETRGGSAAAGGVDETFESGNGGGSGGEEALDGVWLSGGLAQRVFADLGVPSRAWPALEQLCAADAEHHAPALRAALNTRAAADADTQRSATQQSPSSLPHPADDAAGAAALYYGFRLSAPVPQPHGAPAASPSPHPADDNDNEALASPPPPLARRVPGAAAMALPALRCLLRAVVGGVAGDVDGCHRFYDARARVALRRTAHHLRLPWADVALLEASLAAELQAAAPLSAELIYGGDGADRTGSGSRSAHPRLSFRQKAAVAGAALLGGGAFALSAGLAAPALAAGAAAAAAAVNAAGAAASASAAAGSASAAVAAAAAGGTIGGVATGARMHTRLRGLSDAAFVPISAAEDGTVRPPRLAVTLCIAGFLRNATDDVTRPWACLASARASSDCFALRWESSRLLAIGTALPTALAQAAARTALQHGVARTALAGLSAALAAPLALSSASSAIDNDWSVALQRADRAGALLASALADGSWAGGRPVTLVGFGAGARVVFAALETLGQRRCRGCVEHALLLGAPVPAAARERWAAARAAVAGRLVNGRCAADLALATLYRAEHLHRHPAGLRAVALAGVEDADLTDLVAGHGAYPDAIPRIMARLRLRAHDEAQLPRPGPHET